ncbi:MAG: hypothetical protein F6K31_43605 [Symploca sp. SIO2G7]|nr:hypothetical protein [Symploca sp. SIO2G7]
MLFVIGHWSLVIGHLSFVICPLLFVICYLSFVLCHTKSGYNRAVLSKPGKHSPRLCMQRLVQVGI